MDDNDNDLKNGSNHVPISGSDSESMDQSKDDSKDDSSDMLQISYPTENSITFTETSSEVIDKLSEVTQMSSGSNGQQHESIDDEFGAVKLGEIKLPRKKLLSSITERTEDGKLSWFISLIKSSQTLYKFKQAIQKMIKNQWPVTFHRIYMKIVPPKKNQNNMNLQLPKRIKEESNLAICSENNCSIHC